MKEPTDANLKEFGKAINNAIPDYSNLISYMIYKFMRGMYLRNKPKFIQYIAGMQYYEAMILWADYDDILNYFELTGVIFLGWNKSVNKYQAARIDASKVKTSTKTPEPSDVSDVPSKETESVESTDGPSINSQQELQVKSLEQSDDYNLLYNRIAQLQSTLN
jgi:hypothetical protein